MKKNNVLFYLLSIILVSASTNVVMAETKLLSSFEAKTPSTKRLLLVNGYSAEKEKKFASDQQDEIGHYYLELGYEVDKLEIRDWNDFFNLETQNYTRIIWMSHGGFDGPSQLSSFSDDFSDQIDCTDDNGDHQLTGISRLRFYQPLLSRLQTLVFPKTVSEKELAYFQSWSKWKLTYNELVEKIITDDHIQFPDSLAMLEPDTKVHWDTCVWHCFSNWVTEKTPEEREQSRNQCRNQCYVGVVKNIFEFSTSQNGNLEYETWALNHQILSGISITKIIGDDVLDYAFQTVLDVHQLYADQSEKMFTRFTKKIADVLTEDGLIYFNSCNAASGEFAQKVAKGAHRTVAADVGSTSIELAMDRCVKVEKNIPQRLVHIYYP
ncbi:MAG: hypothetical protein KDK51_01760 [Deltaproteobacteria bacterium]|nr:hypothetical protein [Deltaproteobacteria bacterium]